MNNKKNFIKENLRSEDLSLEQQNLLSFLGMEKYLEMCEKFGGSTFTINRIETIYCLSVRNKVLENKGIYTTNQMAVMYGISKSTVYKILKGADK